ncbi:hypothetical protein EDB84DRAFT_644925 [Lactarius hengduanensis]|nr:hypothetical protein EDB84DRAFT_644925 [Lactarius hengduanensis]
MQRRDVWHGGKRASLFTSFFFVVFTLTLLSDGTQSYATTGDPRASTNLFPARERSARRPASFRAQNWVIPNSHSPRIIGATFFVCLSLSSVCLFVLSWLSPPSLPPPSPLSPVFF